MASPSAALIDRQALSELNTLRRGPAWLRLSTHLLLVVIAGWLWRQPDLALPWRATALLLSGIALATCFAPLHECCHRTAFRSRATNDAVAWLAGVLSFYNATFYRRYHQWHHRFTHQPGRDPELEDPAPTSWPGYLKELSGWTWWSGKLRGHARLLWGDLSALPYLNPEVIPQVRRSARLQALVYALVLAVSCVGANGFLFWSWLLPLAVGQPFLRFVLLAEHSGCSFSDDGTANTRTTLTLAPLRWLMWNMPFHAEHHLYPSLPFHALPQAHALIAPQLRHLDHGYLRVHRQLLADLPSLAIPAPGRA
ncbi:fatty acid desaturase [Cyanobium sp. LEGE 06113]|uniref:fatty acid desaturase n=1 Tax=Cyanobium sp. LEGE 06113 TaxID=1297573 RepID=UPI00187E17E4|nr:fatty acid desaturase [Cyanobium sp. LEGE 06113]MBE9154238.1 fatty acid desaturase [Cyanobium sp. LEGE 06113]